MLSLEVKNQIKLHCLKNKQIESCGLLLSNHGTIKVFPCINSSNKPKFHFEISPVDYLKADGLGKIIGCYHSHTKGFGLSEFDKLNAINHKLNYVVYHIPTDYFFEFDYKEPSNIKNYIGRKFEINKSDCVNLVVDYYFFELGINLIDTSRDDDWKKNIPDLLDNSWSKNKNLIKINKNEEIRKNDIILFNYCREFSTHVGIYLGNNYFLHHPRNKFSLVEEYNDSFKRATNYYLRWN